MFEIVWQIILAMAVVISFPFLFMAMIGFLWIFASLTLLIGFSLLGLPFWLARKIRNLIFPPQHK